MINKWQMYRVHNYFAEKTKLFQKIRKINRQKEFQPIIPPEAGAR